MLPNRAALDITPTQRGNVLEIGKYKDEICSKQHQAESFVHVWRSGIEMFPLEPKLHSVTRDMTR